MWKNIIVIVKRPTLMRSIRERIFGNIWEWDWSTNSTFNNKLLLCSTWLSYVGQSWTVLRRTTMFYCPTVLRTMSYCSMYMTDLRLQTLSYCPTSSKYHVLYSASYIIQFCTTFAVSYALFKTLHIEIIDSTSYVLRVDGCLAKYGFHLNHDQWCYTCI